MWASLNTGEVWASKAVQRHFGGLINKIIFSRTKVGVFFVATVDQFRNTSLGWSSLVLEVFWPWKEISELMSSPCSNFQLGSFPEAKQLSQASVPEVPALRSVPAQIAVQWSLTCSTWRNLWNKTLGNMFDLHITKWVPGKSGKHRALQMTWSFWLSGVLARNVYNCSGKAA